MENEKTQKIKFKNLNIWMKIAMGYHLLRLGVLGALVLIYLLVEAIPSLVSAI